LENLDLYKHHIQVNQDVLNFEVISKVNLIKNKILNSIKLDLMF